MLTVNGHEGGDFRSPPAKPSLLSYSLKFVGNQKSLNVAC